MEKSSFFDAELLGYDESGNPLYDREFNSSDFARYFSSFIGNGVFPNPASNCQVVSVDDDMRITIKAGKAWINGYYYINTDDLKVQLDVADGVLNRIDRVVLRLDFIKREIKAYVKKGVFASNPHPQSIQRDADMYELGIADITVNKGTIKITQADIKDLRLAKGLCGVVHGTVEQVDTSQIFAQYMVWFRNKSVEFEEEFKAFLVDLRTQLGGDVAGNLLSKIMAAEDKITDLTSNVGDLTTLNTANKTSTVSAINEVKDEITEKVRDVSAKMVHYAVATGTANSYIANLTPPVTSLLEGMGICVKINIANTGASTINVNELGAKSIKKSNGSDVLAGNLKVGGVYTLRYDGLNFILQGEGGEYGTAIASDVLTGKTIGTENGVVAGSMTNRGSVIITPNTSNQTISQGYHSGSGYVRGDGNLASSNIRSGVSIFGVSGTLTPSQSISVSTSVYMDYNAKTASTSVYCGFSPKYWMASLNNLYFVNTSSGNRIIMLSGIVSTDLYTMKYEEYGLGKLQAYCGGTYVSGNYLYFNMDFSGSMYPTSGQSLSITFKVWG